jgi:quercetin dioxygenase-like cupin family protein
LAQRHRARHKLDSKKNSGARDGANAKEGIVAMVVTRWQAPVLPTPEQIKMIFHAEGLSPIDETLLPKAVIPDHRHPFDEIRMVMSGVLFMNISGNQILLRTGDRIDIPANTRHSKTAEGEEPCICVYANRPF